MDKTLRVEREEYLAKQLTAHEQQVSAEFATHRVTPPPPHPLSLSLSLSPPILYLLCMCMFSLTGNSLIY